MNTSKKNVLWNIVGSTASSFNSLFFVIAATRINGVEKAGVFSYAFATSCILFVLGSYIVRVFQVTDREGKCTDGDYVAHRIFTCVLMLFAAVLFVWIKGYDVYKTAVILLICGYKCAEAFSEVLYGIVQKQQLLYQVGISLFVKAVLSLLGFVVVDFITKNLPAACLTAFLANILFIAVYDIPNVRKAGFSGLKFSGAKMLYLFRTGFFTFLLTILTTYLINAPRYAIDDLLNDSMQTVYGIIILPATIMALLGLYIIHPLITRIADCLEQRDYAALKRIVFLVVWMILLLGIAVFAVAFLLEEPVLSLIYGLDLKPYKTCMMIIIAGAIMYGVETAVSNILIAFRRTGIQAFIFAFTTVLATVLSYVVVPRFEIYGASFVYLGTMTLLAIVLSIVLFFQMRRYKFNWDKDCKDRSFSTTDTPQ